MVIILFFEDLLSEPKLFQLDSTIKKFDGNLYLITSNATFSAANYIATIVRDNNLGIIVGEPTGNQPTCQTGASVFKLPKTKLVFYMSDVFLERPNTSKNHIDAVYPDILKHKTFQHVIDGINPAMEYIYSKCKEN